MPTTSEHADRAAKEVRDDIDQELERFEQFIGKQFEDLRTKLAAVNKEFFESRDLSLRKFEARLVAAFERYVARAKGHEPDERRDH
jgi:hypothetical protein